MARNFDESTWKAPLPATPQQIEEWKRDPRNHVTPGLQEIVPTYNEIGRKPAEPAIQRRQPVPTKAPVLH